MLLFFSPAGSESVYIKFTLNFINTAILISKKTVVTNNRDSLSKTKQKKGLLKATSYLQNLQEDK